MSLESKQKQYRELAAVVLAVVAMATTMTIPAKAQGNQRPLSDFIEAQGSTSCFTPPAPAQLGWGTGAFADGSVKTNGNAGLTPARFAVVDYTGLEAKYLFEKYGIKLGTTVSGSVQERPLADGRALVTVDLHTENAMGWAIQDPTDFNADPLVFGARVLDVANGKTPALGHSHFHAVFVNTAPAAKLPDLVCVNAAFCGQLQPCPAGFELDLLSHQASITGLLHSPVLPDPVSWTEGTPGRLDITQSGLLQVSGQNGGKGPLSDAFPVESIALQPIVR
jgi:hypothetical protein